MYQDVLYVPIEEFEDYYISSLGEVVNTKTNRIMTLSPTQNDEMTVGLMKDGYQYRRSVKVLVARAFVEGESSLFNTPIQLDGNKFNLRADNIMWRPRWFAWKYSRQFRELYPEWLGTPPVIDIVNNLRYERVLDAAIENGILCRDIIESTRTARPVFPTAQIFTFL